MSHPVPSHDYSEQTKHESNKEYRARKNKALKKKKSKKVIEDPDSQYGGPDDY